MLERTKWLPKCCASPVMKCVAREARAPATIGQSFSGSSTPLRNAGAIVVERRRLTAADSR
jgi:hypothetical protein